MVILQNKKPEKHNCPTGKLVFPVGKIDA